MEDTEPSLPPVVDTPVEVAELLVDEAPVELLVMPGLVPEPRVKASLLDVPELLVEPSRSSAQAPSPASIITTMPRLGP